MKKKIVLFGPYPPPYGGVAIYVHSLYKFLPQFKFDCELRIYRQDAVEDTVQPNSWSIYQNFSNLKKNDCCLDSCTFFFEYTRYPEYLRVAVTWCFLKIIHRFKWVKIFHDGTLPARYDSFSFTQKIIFRILIKLVDELIVVSEDIQEWLQNRIKVKQRITLIKSLLPIPPEDFAVSLSADIERVINSHNKIVCGIGVFTPDYGFKHISAAVENIRNSSGLNIGLILIDGAFACDDEYKAEIVKNREWITVLSNLPHPNVLQVLKKSDVFVRGVAYESYGLSKVESIWCGTPVVATRVGETRGMLLYDFGNEEQLIHQMQEAIFNLSVKNAISIWAEFYRKEAEKNLTDIVSIIKQ